MWLKPVPFTCDVCGAVKKESNHWWKLAVESDVLVVAKWDEAGWLNRDDTPVTHLCGRACVLKKVEEFMEKQSVSGLIHDLAASGKAEQES